MNQTIEKLKQQRDRLLQRVLKAIARSVRRHGTKTPDNLLNPDSIWQLDLCETGTAPMLPYVGNSWTGVVEVQLITADWKASNATIFFHADEAGFADADPAGFGVDGLLDILEAVQPAAGPAKAADDTDLVCDECGRPMVINDDGTANHIFDEKPEGTIDDIDYDTDADHVAVNAKAAGDTP